MDALHYTQKIFQVSFVCVTSLHFLPGIVFFLYTQTQICCIPNFSLVAYYPFTSAIVVVYFWQLRLPHTNPKITKRYPHQIENFV